jgi:hypothetical protein
MLTEFQIKVTLENYQRGLRLSWAAREQLIKHGHADRLDEIARTGLDPEDLMIRNQEVTLIASQERKEKLQLRKMVYNAVCQNGPSTGQPMSQEQYYETMGWVGDSSNDA